MDDTPFYCYIRESTGLLYVNHRLAPAFYRLDSHVH